MGMNSAPKPRPIMAILIFCSFIVMSLCVFYGLICCDTGTDPCRPLFQKSKSMAGKLILTGCQGFPHTNSCSQFLIIRSKTFDCNNPVIADRFQCTVPGRPVCLAGPRGSAVILGYLYMQQFVTS